ncbi:MAG: hypothetical protein AAF436_14665 [Myxococcota bacterium]
MNGLTTWGTVCATLLFVACGESGSGGSLDRECDPSELRFEPSGVSFVVGNDATTRVALVGERAQDASPPTTEDRTIAFSFLPLDNTVCLGCAIGNGGLEMAEATVVAKSAGDPMAGEDDCVAVLPVFCGIGSGGAQNSQRECALNGFGPPYIFLP